MLDAPQGTMQSAARPIPDGRRASTLQDVTTNLLGIVRRRWLLMLAIAVPLFLIALAFIAMMTPKYDAMARIRIDPSRNPLQSAQQQMPNAGLNSEAIETEVSVMSSVDLARQVVKRLKLDEDPEFNVRPQTDASEQGNASKIDAVARRVMRSLTVQRDKLSYIIAITFRANAPDKAARIANAFAETYLEMRVGSQVGTSERQASFFSQRLAELGKEVSAAEAKTAYYRAQAGIATGGNGSAGTIVDQQIAPLSSQLATAEASAAAARSQARVAQSQLATGGIDAISEVRNSNVIADMRRQRAEIVRNMGEVDTHYGPRHPESIRVHQQVNAIDQQIGEEAKRIVNSLTAAAAAADAQVASLRGAMRSLEQQRSGSTQAQAVADGLEREAAVKRAAYDRMSELSLQSTQSSRNSIAQAEIIDRAEPPLGPTSPNKPLFGALAFIVALSIGTGVGFGKELMQGGLHTAADLEERFGLPMIAAIPVKKAKRRSNGVGSDSDNPAQSLIHKPATAYGEAIRSICAAVIRPADPDCPRVVAFTSALPNEGKTTVSLSFSRVNAIMGSRTLLIDCDLRRAGLRNIVGPNANGGLVDVLNGTLTLKQAIVADEVANLDLLLVNAPHFTAENLVGDQRMQALIEEAKQSYDQIVLDLSPLLGLVDARLLSALADVTCFIVRWGKTPPSAVEMALSTLHAHEANVAGAIYSMVDTRADVLGGSFYSKHYANYYEED